MGEPFRLPHRFRFSGRRRRHGDDPADLRPNGPSIERIVADLCRLERDADRLHADPHIYARVFRLRAVAQAYDDTVLLACRALDVDADGLSSPLSDLDRLRLEAELARRGLIW